MTIPRNDLGTIFRSLKRKQKKSFQKMCEEMDIDYQTLYRFMNPDKFPDIDFRDRILRAIENYISERQSLWQKE